MRANNLVKTVKTANGTYSILNGNGSVNASLSTAPVYPATLNIMPIGDSITAGYTDSNLTTYPFTFGYRDTLYTLLTNAGVTVQYMGSSPEPWNGAFADPTIGGTYTPSFDLRDINQDNHHGYATQTVTYLNTNIASWLSTEEPDIILLKIGINGQDESGLVTLLNYITTNYPNIHIIVAQIIPKDNGIFGVQPLVDYNNYIRNYVVPYYRGLGKNVSSVDLYKPFLTDWTDNTSINWDLYSNAINHPDDDGYEIIANTFKEAIDNIFKPNI